MRQGRHADADEYRARPLAVAPRGVPHLAEGAVEAVHSLADRRGHGVEERVADDEAGRQGDANANDGLERELRLDPRIPVGPAEAADHGHVQDQAEEAQQPVGDDRRDGGGAAGRLALGDQVRLDEVAADAAGQEHVVEGAHQTQPQAVSQGKRQVERPHEQEPAQVLQRDHDDHQPERRDEVDRLRVAREEILERLPVHRHDEPEEGDGDEVLQQALDPPGGRFHAAPSLGRAKGL